MQALLHDEPLNQVPPSATAELAVPAASTDAGATMVDGGVVVPVDGGVAVPPTDGGVGPGGPGGSGGALGRWRFDDCNSDRTDLRDETGANTAFRSVDATCTTGVAGGLAVALAATEDIIYVPDQPNFTFEQGVTVAGWFNPAAVGGTRTLFRKRDSGTSSFALVLDAGKFEFVVSLGNGRAISVAALEPATPGVFQHVAATYDGTAARLYVGGVEVNQLTVAGTIPRGPGPLLMGNDGSERRFDGAIDDTTFATRAFSADEVLQLTCVPQAPTVAISPVVLPPIEAGGSTQVDISLTNNNPAVCAPITFQIVPFQFDPSFSTDPPSGVATPSAPVPSGETRHQALTVLASTLAPVGVSPAILLQVSEPTTQFSTLATLFVTIVEPAGCHVDTERELMIRDTSVVDDPVRTDPATGAWSFKRLVENMAPTPADAPAMVEAVLTTMAHDQTINGFVVAGRRGVQTLVLDAWPRTPDGALDLSRPPLRLQAIVDRFDLRNLAHGDAGEGRFVFAFEQQGAPLQATIIFEYKLPAATDDDVRGWADAFHQLGALPFGADYNAALEAITARFAGRGARPDHPNGSAINTVRTNEISFGNGAPWELREFRLSAASGRLEPAPVELTPDRSFDQTATLASYIAQNQAAILTDTHVVPTVFAGQPFEAGAVFNDLTTWFAPGVDSEARRHFASNTCNGCHSLQETNTVFLQISPRFAGGEAQLSPFLAGTTVPDPVTGVARRIGDLDRRNLDLKAVVCDDAAAQAAVGTTLQKGISRVH